jgi:hypothetical protein
MGVHLPSEGFPVELHRRYAGVPEAISSSPISRLYSCHACKATWDWSSGTAAMTSRRNVPDIRGGHGHNDPVNGARV